MYEVVAADLESLFIRWRPKTFWLFRHQGRDPLDFYPLSVFVVKGTQTTHSPRFTTKRRSLKALCLWLLKRKLLNRALAWICFVITNWNICTKGYVVVLIDTPSTSQSISLNWHPINSWSMVTTDSYVLINTQWHVCENWLT